MSLKDKIRTIPDFPKEGIMFRDITTLLKDPEGFKEAVDMIADHCRNIDFDIVAGIEARGFILGGAIAYKLGKGFVPVRKPGKLPFESISHEYELEYGSDSLEVHTDAIKKGDRVLLIDDLLATGGTALAGAKLIEKLGGQVVKMAFVIDLPDVGGGKKITESGYSMFHLIEFEGD